MFPKVDTSVNSRVYSVRTSRASLIWGCSPRVTHVRRAEAPASARLRPQADKLRLSSQHPRGRDFHGDGSVIHAGYRHRERVQDAVRSVIDVVREREDLRRALGQGLEGGQRCEAQLAGIGGDRRSGRVEAQAGLILRLLEETPDIAIEELAGWPGTRRAGPPVRLWHDPAVLRPASHHAQIKLRMRASRTARTS